MADTELPQEEVPRRVSGSRGLQEATDENPRGARALIHHKPLTAPANQPKKLGVCSSKL